VRVKRTILFLCLTLTPGIAASDDRSEAEAKVREYFDLFNARDVDAIVERVYSTPVHVASTDGHRAYVTGDDARSSLAGLYRQIEAQGWVRSVIREVKPCAVSEGLVFAEVNYTRDKADGQPIAPGLRSNVYVLQKLEPGWRITAFYGRDPDKGLDCRR
jgi:ketosteroid isomerase-like protein